MTWLRRYRIRHYSGNSLWLLPVLGVLAAMAVVRLLHWIDQAAGWKDVYAPVATRGVPPFKYRHPTVVPFAYAVEVCKNLPKRPRPVRKALGIENAPAARLLPDAARIHAERCGTVRQHLFP